MEKTIYVFVGDEKDGIDDADIYGSIEELSDSRSWGEISKGAVYEFELKSKGSLHAAYVPDAEKKGK